MEGEVSPMIKELCYLYYSAYNAGYLDTIEGCYAPIEYGEMTDLAKQVQECLKSGDMPMTSDIAASPVFDFAKPDAK